MIPKYKDKVCALCGKTFTPIGGVAKYCKLPIERTCIVCGEKYTTVCHPKSPVVCDKPECKLKAGAKASAQAVTRTCRVCGKPFTANSSRQLDCGREITKICEICGKSYKSKCGLRWSGHTCEDPKCKAEYAHRGQQSHYLKSTKTCVWCGKEFHPVNNTQILCGEAHTVVCKTCGKTFTVDASYTPEAAPKYCSEECRRVGYTTRPNHTTPESIEKAIQTKIAKYGENFGSDIFKKSIKTYQERTGYSHPAHDPKVRSKQAKAISPSKLETRIKSLLDEYQIEYIHHYVLAADGLSHEYDFYLPKYKILIDADGLYFHSYVSDPNGKQVRDDYDDVRLKLIPEDHMFHLIIEGHEESGIKQLTEIIRSMDNNIFDYTSHIFTWCRTTGFPYPEYDISRLDKDYHALCNYNKLASYNPNSRLGESVIRKYHRSIYSAHCGVSPSPIDGWNNDDILKKVILNRLIYINDVDPSKVLRGLYISKLAPRVSIFNPVLTKYLVNKYLGDYDEIFDPFSGFSGRLLGVAASGKSYIGHDINTLAVSESNEIIQALHLENCEVTTADMLENSGEFQCLLTCPPYGKKEIYAEESVFKSCDDWITECLARYKCQKYIFVVDNTEKYAEYVAEDVITNSHLNQVVEHVVVINSPG